ncbi:MAG: transposase [Candidatus Bipolaricaulia bacterium]
MYRAGSAIYRGRAVPLVWRVLDQPSTSVAYAIYQDLLDRAAQLLPLPVCRVVLLADRGFADTKLMRHLDRLGWHWRIRIKRNFWVYRAGQWRRKVKAICVAGGQARFFHDVAITEHQYGPVHLALARPGPGGSRTCWVVVSDEPTDLETFEEYGLRFDIEENFLDDKSNGFQLESSEVREAQALSRLCFVMAMTTLYLVSQGTEVVAQGKRRWVDPHWFRGSSYLKIGWNWIKRALMQGWELITQVRLVGGADPEPARASKPGGTGPPRLSFSSVEVTHYAWGVR